MAEIAKSYKEHMCEMADFAPAIKASSEGFEGPGSKALPPGRTVGNALNPLDWTGAGFDSRGTLGPDYGGRCGINSQIIHCGLGLLSSSNCAHVVQEQYRCARNGRLALFVNGLLYYRKLTVCVIEL